MASDPLDQLQSMFPTIDGDVIAIVFSESDKDVSSTVEKLLQLVPIDESEREFPSLQSTVQRPQPHVHSSYQVKSPNYGQPERSSSGPAATGNTSLTSQRANQRLQGPTHIPPAVNKRQQQKNLAGNEVGGGISMTGGHGNVMLATAPQKVQQKPYQPTHQSKAYGQTNLGKGTAPGNQRRAGGGANMAGVHGDNVAVHGQTSQQKPGFYQLGGNAVNSMPALNALEPSSYFYHQALQPQRTNLQQQAQQQLHHQYQFQPQSHSHSQFQPQAHSQAQAQAQYRAQQQQQQQQQAQRMGTGVIGNGMYGYSGMRPNDPFFTSWNSSRQSDFSNATNTKNSQFYATLQHGQHQNWPNVVGGAGGKAASLQQYQQQQEHRAKTQNSNPLPYSTGGYPIQAVNSLVGGQSDQNHKPGWPMYSVGGNNTSGSDERGKMDAISALLQPERSLSSSSNDFGRYRHIQSESSLSKLQTTSVHHGHNRGDVPGNKVDSHSRKTGAPVISSNGAASVSHSSKGLGGSEVKGDSVSKKLIILRGLPGSGKTTLARSLVGSGGVICCTDDFFVKNGEYVFDPSLLEENHEKNKCKARDAMKSGCSPVIIDNTNTNAWEMKPYVLLAMEHGYAVEILEPDTPWRFKTAELARRNSHGVPRQSLEKMLERYDHRVTLETIIISQQPERKPPMPKPNDSEPSRSISGGSGGQSASTGGQRGGGRTTKVSPPTPRQQQGGGANETDHTHSSKQQNRSSQLSPRPGRRDQKSNDSSGGRVSPRPANQRSQRSSKDNSASAATTGRNGNEQYHHQHHQNHHFATSSTSEGGASHVSVIGEGRPSSSDAKKKTTPLSSNQQQHQSTHPNQTVSTSSTSSNKSQNDQFSRAKGRRTTAQQQQQAGSKSTLSTTTAASNRKRSLSPSRGPSSSSKQNSQTVGGRENGHHRQYSDKAVGNGYTGQKRSGGGGEGKRSRKGTEEDMDDEFLWDSSEETEILDAGEGVSVGGADGVRNGPVFMTDKPPKNASFRPVPQVGKAMVNGGTVGSGGVGARVREGKRVPVFEVWKDSDDEDIDEGGEEEESPLPIPWSRKGHCGQQQILQRTVEIANVSDKTNVDVFEPSASEVEVVQAPPSHPWERTQSARNLQEVNDHFTSLIRRVQSANPTQPLSTLSESEGSRSVVDISDENFNVFTMSSVWGSQSGLLGSKIRLFDDDAHSKLRVDRIDSMIKSCLSLQSSNSSEGLLEKQKKAQSFYSMLDALTEELPATTEKVRGEESGGGVVEERVGVRSKLLDEAIQSTQSSLTVQEAIEDEVKYPLRNKLIEELLTENASVRGESKHTLQSVIESASDVLETKVDIDTFLPERLLETDLNRGSLQLPIKTDASIVDNNDKPLRGTVVSFLADFSFEEGCSLDALTDRVFVEEQLNPEQNFSSLQAAFQTIAQKTFLKQPSSFTKIGIVGQRKEKESLEESSDSTFEDPAIVSKVCLEGESDTKLKKLRMSEGKQPAPERGERKSFSVSSPEQLEPLDVFPSAFDEGLAASFPLSAASNETADKSQSTSREQTVEPNSSPLQSQTPVNEQGVSDADNVGDDSGGDDGHGQEELTFEPLSAETDKPVDEGISAEDSALTLTTSEPSLEGYYLDWNTPCVDNLTSSNWESDLLFLIECFPDLEPNYLSTLLKMCKGSLEGAISTILVSHSSLINGPADQSFMYFDSQLSTDTTDDASSTISSASYSELYSHTHGFGGQQLDSSPEQQTATVQSKVDQVQGDRQKAIFSIGGENDEICEPVLVPFFDEPEPECANDEEIARALQEELDHEDQQSNQEATAGTSGGDRNVETEVDRRDQSSSHGSEDARETHPSTGDENLELRLSASLARQLQEMFGPVTDKLPFKGEIGDEDLIVLLSERAAHEIYRKWLDTLHAKRIGYRVQSEIDMTRDEALARRLQEEEDSKAGKHHRKKHHKFRHLTEPSSLAVMAAENYRAHHNSSPPQWKGALGSSPQTGGGLTDIMGEQMAQQVQEDEVAQVVKEKSQPNLSLKLQLKDLYSRFPSLEQPLVNQTLVKNKFDIESTVAELEQVLLHPPQRESIDGCGFSKAVVSGQAKSPAAKGIKSGVRGGGTTGSPAKRKLFKSEGKEQKQDGKGLPTDRQDLDEGQHQIVYLELRAEAALHAKLRAENFMKAAHARSKKQYEVAQYYAQQGHLHTEKMKEANQRAADATLKYNFTSSDELDLHGLHVDEAITALEEKLNSCKGSKLRVVTGQGIHSKGKGARIRPAVINYLQDKKYKIIYDEKNPGVLNVKIK